MVRSIGQQEGNCWKPAASSTVAKQAKPALRPDSNYLPSLSTTLPDRFGAAATATKPNFSKNCYINSLALAKENLCRTIAFPCISTGVFHYPKEQAAQIALETVLSNITAPIKKVIFCCFSDSDAEIYRKIASEKRAITASHVR